MRERLIEECTSLGITKKQLSWLLSVSPRTVNNFLRKIGLALKPGRPSQSTELIRRSFPNLLGLLEAGLSPQEASRIYVLPLRDVLKLFSEDGG